MTEVMMILGDYAFSLDTAAYQAMRRVAEYSWRAQPRLTRAPAQQYVGLGEDTITLEGVIYPHYKGGFGQLDAMRSSAANGKPLDLVSGNGDVMGLWAIRSIEDGSDQFPGRWQGSEKDLHNRACRLWR